MKGRSQAKSTHEYGALSNDDWEPLPVFVSRGMSYDALRFGIPKPEAWTGFPTENSKIVPLGLASCRCLNENIVYLYLYCVNGLMLHRQ